MQTPGRAATHASVRTLHITMEQAKPRAWCMMDVQENQQVLQIPADSLAHPSSSGDVMPGSLPGDCALASLPLPAFGVTAPNLA